MGAVATSWSTGMGMQVRAGFAPVAKAGTAIGTRAGA